MHCETRNETSSALCGGRGVACVFDTGEYVCFCQDGYTGFGDFNPLPDNCDVFKPILYFLGVMAMLVDVGILFVVYWAVKQRTLKRFWIMIVKRNSIAAITIMSTMVATFQIAWISLRLSDLERRAIAVDAPTTITFAISLFFIYVVAPHVLRHYAKLTFSDSRLMMLNVVGREQAKMRAKMVRPLVNIFLPLCSAVASFGTCIAVDRPSEAKTALKIVSVSTGIFLFFTLILIRVLVTPMVRDMTLAVSVNRLTGTDQEKLVIATRKLVIFQYIIVGISVAYLPVMLLWGFLPQLRGTISYIYLLGALFCGCIGGFSVWTLTNISPGPQMTLFRCRNKDLDKVNNELGVELSSATPIKPDA